MKEFELLKLKELFPDYEITRTIESGSLEDAINYILNQSETERETGKEFDIDELIRLKKQYPTKDEILLLDTLRDQPSKIIFKSSEANSSGNSVNEQEYESLKEMFFMFSEESIFQLLQQKSYQESMDELLRLQNIKLIEQDKGLQELMELFPLISRSGLKKRLKNSSVEETIDALLNDQTNIWTEANKVKDIPTQCIEYKFNAIEQENITEETNILGDTREEALDLTVKRNDLFERAKIEFKKGQTGKLAAQFYSQQAHQLTKTIKQTHSNAANKIFLSNNPNVHTIYKLESRIKNDDHVGTSYSKQKNMINIGNSPGRQDSTKATRSHKSNCNVFKEYYQLDFHGLTLDESKEKLDIYLKEWVSIKNRDKWLKIITGAGNHSVSGVGVLYNGLKKYILELGWKVENGGNGWFFVRE